MTSPTQQQVGGNHYREMRQQPEAFIHANGIGWHEGNAIKYLCRWRKRGGVQDLEKARHYIDLLIHHETPLTPREIAMPEHIYHNPANLESAGEGYRFCLVGETEDDASHWWSVATGDWRTDGFRASRPIAKGITYRTNKPLPTS